MDIKKRGPICVVSFNWYKGMNLLDAKALNEIGDALRAMEGEEQIRAVIITGNKNFSAGADIKAMKDMSPEDAGSFSRLGQSVCDRIENLGKGVIAAVSGYALGGGCELALACDMRIAGESAQFGQLEMNLGIIPGFGGTQRLARLVGMGKAKELILTGRILDAEEAHAIGLVNKVVKEEDLMREAEEMAGIIAQKSPSAIRHAKRLLNEHFDIRRGLASETSHFAECFADEDHREGLAAFLEKRAPRFKGP